MPFAMNSIPIEAIKSPIILVTIFIPVCPSFDAIAGAILNTTHEKKAILTIRQNKIV